MSIIRDENRFRETLEYHHRSPRAIEPEIFVQKRRLEDHENNIRRWENEKLVYGSEDQTSHRRWRDRHHDHNFRRDGWHSDRFPNRKDRRKDLGVVKRDPSFASALSTEPYERLANSEAVNSITKSKIHPKKEEGRLLTQSSSKSIKVSPISVTYTDKDHIEKVIIPIEIDQSGSDEWSMKLEAGKMSISCSVKNGHS